MYITDRDKDDRDRECEQLRTKVGLNLLGRSPKVIAQ